MQLAAAKGYKVAGTASSPEGQALVKSLGASTVVNHKIAGYEEELKKAFPSGFDVIVEMVASANLSKDVDLLARRGSVEVVGSRPQAAEIASPFAILTKAIVIRGIIVSDVTVGQRLKTAAEINQLFESGVKPVVYKIYDLKDVSKGHEDLWNNTGARGNLAVRVAELD